MRRIDESSKRDFFAALDVTGRIGMMVITDRDILNKPRFKALEISALQVSHGWQTYFWLTDPAFESLFELFCLDLEQSSESIFTEYLTSFLAERVLRWRKLFETGAGQLSNSELRGLFGELVILNGLAERFSPESVIYAWGGPLGAAQDFVFPAWSIETKTIGPNALHVQINSLEQLNIQSDRRLLLAVVMITERSHDSGAGNTFEDLKTNILDQIAGNESLKSEFLSRLRATGYDGSKYGTLKYHAFGSRYYEVVGSFPRLTPDQMPHGIETARYELVLSSLEAFEVGSPWHLLRDIEHG